MSAVPMPTPPLTIREVLKFVPVRRLWLAQLVNVLGDFLAIFAVLSYVSFNLHASPAQVALISVSLFFASAAMLFVITALGCFRLPQRAGANSVTPQEQSAD